jgi:hypothetical protein
MKQSEIQDLIDGRVDIILTREDFSDSLKIKVKNNKQKEIILDLTEEEINLIGQKLIQFNKKRTDILFSIIELEKTIDYIIQNILFDSKRNENSVLFDAFFMKSNYVSFFHKWKILKELLKSH